MWWSSALVEVCRPAVGAEPAGLVAVVAGVVVQHAEGRREVPQEMLRGAPQQLSALKKVCDMTDVGEGDTGVAQAPLHRQGGKKIVPSPDDLQKY
ncbi:hypothetical protein Daura_35475 [Dactylosporangium aurantiacum]|uniref:Uncharacterized protein n=1 Tax=Dactylosporangium aurantiacum TaxID=35754 RepID=A0A9Q9IG63_9ACTN|nr:hypothetical protein [Dactylosporangium aurantiacum]MDG6103527.1 hypothetical protein [Dactylosporangium aurantiacum]UWZ51975.1 hypothetical protein Daura_35475 [Dactylosporangium aurantiacum]